MEAQVRIKRRRDRERTTVGKDGVAIGLRFGDVGGIAPSRFDHRPGQRSATDRVMNSRRLANSHAQMIGPGASDAPTRGCSAIAAQHASGQLRGWSLGWKRQSPVFKVKYPTSLLAMRNFAT